MDNPLARFREFILSPSHSRTISALVILIIAAAIPLTVLVAQKQQEIRQRAATATCVTGTGTTNAACGGGAGTTYSCTSTTTCEEYTYACRGTPATCVKGPHASVAVSNCSVGSICNPAKTAYCTAFNTRDCIYGCTPTLSGGTCKPAPTPPTTTTQACSLGAYQCSGQTLQKCDVNASTGFKVWTNVSTCSSSQICSASSKSCITKCPGSCQASSSYCGTGSYGAYNSAGNSYCNTSTNGGHPYCCNPTTTTTCTAGTGSTAASCGGNAKYACTSSTNCEEYTYRCSGSSCISAAHQSVAKTYCAKGSICNPTTTTPRPTTTTTCVTGTGKTNASCGGAVNDTYKCTATATTATCEQWTYACRGTPATCTNGPHAPVAITAATCGTSCKPTGTTCASPKVTCNGVCTNTLTDNNNCGTCGTVCTTGQTCTNGTCTTPTVPDCNATPQTTNACVATTANTCSVNNGTQTAQYTTYNGSTTCNPVNITQPCTVPSCDVGNVCANGTCVAQASPTPTGTPIPGNTYIALRIGMDAVGSVGDNENPDSSSSNQSPQRTSRDLAVQIFNSNNSQVFAQVGSINYNSTSGVFEGTVDLGANFASGNYIVKVKSDGHLRRIIPGIQNLSPSVTQPIQLPGANLVAGDVDSNNALNINDYNILLSCVTSPFIANIDDHALCNSNANYVILSDLEDNGVVNEFDYNLFLREYAVQNGD
ncbi:MAG: hypothetical protein M1444_02590 [Patescibacteria group bacterium]|nr:hypothetical protein [Patescibacteria group bacterium]